MVVKTYSLSESPAMHTFIPAPTVRDTAFKPEADKTAGKHAAPRARFLSSITRELLIAGSGIVLVMFILGHVAGNFFLFAGAAAYNSHSEHLHSLGIVLFLIRLGLVAALLVHVFLTVSLALENRAARKTRYAVSTTAGGTDVAKLTMIYTGLLLVAFMAFHLVDFTLSDHTGSRSMVGGESLGLYGVVWNAFANPLHSLFYIVAVCAVGLHLSNAVSTIWVTLGVLTDAATAKVKRISKVVGALVALAFCSIPLYVLAMTYLGR